jgi:predicted metal-dependent hydrolase
MTNAAPDYDPRYLAGTLFFNAQDFFEAHEVWEDLWAATAGPERRFYQGLIQAAVGLFHFGNGNVRGATRLFHSARDYMKPFLPRHQGLDVAGFWQQMQECFAEVLAGPEPAPPSRLRPDQIPSITLDPAPAAWPDAETFLREDETGHA